MSSGFASLEISLSRTPSVGGEVRYPLHIPRLWRPRPANMMARVSGILLEDKAKNDYKRAEKDRLELTWEQPWPLYENCIYQCKSHPLLEWTSQKLTNTPGNSDGLTLLKNAFAFPSIPPKSLSTRVYVLARVSDNNLHCEDGGEGGVIV